MGLLVLPQLAHAVLQRHGDLVDDHQPFPDQSELVAKVRQPVHQTLRLILLVRESIRGHPLQLAQVIVDAVNGPMDGPVTVLGNVMALLRGLLDGGHTSPQVAGALLVQRGLELDDTGEQSLVLLAADSFDGRFEHMVAGLMSTGARRTGYRFVQPEGLTRASLARDLGVKQDKTTLTARESCLLIDRIGARQTQHRGDEW